MRFLNSALGTLLIAVLLCALACESAQDEIARQEAAAQKTKTKAPEGPDGQAIFRQYCVACHGADGKLGLSGAKDLTQSVLTLDARVEQVTHGKNLMAPYGGILKPEEIKAVAEYTMQFKK